MSRSVAVDADPGQRQLQPAGTPLGGAPHVAGAHARPLGGLFGLGR